MNNQKSITFEACDAISEILLELSQDWMTQYVTYNNVTIGCKHCAATINVNVSTINHTRFDELDAAINEQAQHLIHDTQCVIKRANAASNELMKEC